VEPGERRCPWQAVAEVFGVFSWRTAVRTGRCSQFSSLVLSARARLPKEQASHRVFQLVGESGRHLESLKLWTRWKALNGIHLERDITPGFYPVQKAMREGEIA